MPNFECDPEKFLNALGGMKTDPGYMYVVVCFRIYEIGGPCNDPIESLARRTGMNKRRAADALEWLFRVGKLYRSDGGIMNKKAEDVIASLQRHARASQEGSSALSKKGKGKQCPPPENAHDMPPAQNATYISSLFPESKTQSPSKEARKKEPSPTVDDWPADFGDQFWAKYPPGRKYDKAKVFKKLAKLRAERAVTWSVMMAGLDRFLATHPEPQYTCAPIVWLNSERWNADYGNRIGATNGQQSDRVPSHAADTILDVARRRMDALRNNKLSRPATAPLPDTGGAPGGRARGSDDAACDLEFSPGPDGVFRGPAG